MHILEIVKRESKSRVARAGDVTILAGRRGRKNNGTDS